MPPKSKGTPAKGTPAKSGAQSPARKGGPADPKQDAEEQKVLLKAIQDLAKAREKESENVLLKRLKAKDRKVARTKKTVKISPAELPAATAAATKIQSWARMLRVWRPARRRHNSVVEALGQRLQFGLTDLEHPPEELAENSVLRQLPAHQSAIALSKNVKTAQYQAAALHLQAFVRARRGRTSMIQVLEAALVLNSEMRMTTPRTEWRLKLAGQTLRTVRERAFCQLGFNVQKRAISHLQAVCRRCVREVVSDQKRKVHQETFKRAYVNHKMWMMREIWVRRDAIIEIQSQIRRALANDEYIDKILTAREANRARRTRRESAVLLTSRCRMALNHLELHRHVEKYNLLRRLVRTRIAEEKYYEKLLAADALQIRLRAVAVQLQPYRLSLRLPLKRHTQYFPDAISKATVLQASCRRWCMEAMGQASQVEMHPITGEGRLKLCMDQQRDAAVELQMHVRRLLANNPDERLQRRGYARVLTATELLHAQLRRVRVRNLIRNLMEMYGIMTLQAIVRRNKVRKGYGRQLDSASCLVYASRRSLVTRWYVRSEWAQRKLQAYAKMTTTPPPDLKYSHMPTRELAKIMQTRCRSALARHELVQQWDSAITLQTIIRCRLRRLLYLQSKAWSSKATRGGANDRHKFFGSLVATPAKGTAMWRTRQYVERTKERGPLWKTADFASSPLAHMQDAKDVKAVTAVRFVTTEQKRHTMQAEEVQETIEKRVKTDAERLRNGCLFNFQIPSGSRRILNQGRLVEVLSCTQVILDPLTSSEIEDEYRHFFLENNAVQRRIIKYTPDHVATVVPPFEVRPVVNTMYYVIDLEPTPIEPNLVRIRRERQRKAATCLQYACKYYAAKKIFRELKWERDDAQRKKDAYEAIQRAYEAELEAARRKMQAEEAARREAMAEGRRLLQELQQRQDEKAREKEEQEQARHDRLMGLTPKVPVAPSRLSEGAAPSPRRRQMRSISSASYSQLMGTPMPGEGEDSVAQELRRRIAFESSQLDLSTLSEAPREGGYSRASSTGDADSEAAPLVSVGQVRRRVRKVSHGLHVDRSPPKMDRETSAALEALDESVSAGEVSVEEAEERRKKLIRHWKMSPKTSPRERLNNSQPFDLSPR